jgi:serine/threonine-protein kinase
MIGSKVLHYKILEKLGEGGMGVVYKAEDTKLNRLVAIKLLPPHLLVSQDDKSRFQREAKAAAALNHSNIGTVYEINEHEGSPFIAMEYVEGETLNHHIKKGPLKLQDAIDIIIQVAQGLKAAHVKGIVHRDIKCSNIILSSDKQAKILDFGLAKTSMSTKLTQMGSTIGTVAYMSPEQVNGTEVDQRTDLWSLGVVLYEMISGHLPFRAEYEQAIFFAILNEQPEPLTALRTGVPMSLEWIVAKLMAKNPDERYQNTADLIIDLKAVDVTQTGFSRVTQTTISAAKPLSKKNIRTSRTPWIIAAVASLFSLLLIVLFFLRPVRLTHETKRFNISAISSETQDVLKTDVQVMDLSPDGTKLVYCINDGGRSFLVLRTLNSFELQPLEGTDNATGPFFSPDGQWIGFCADGKIKKVSARGGSVEILADAPGFRGGSWGIDDNIVFSPSYGSGLLSVPVSGGEVKVISVPDSSLKERTHRWPQILSDGKQVLYTIGDVDNPNSYDDANIAIQSLETGERQLLDVRGEMARYIEPGYLIIARRGILLAAPFNLKKKKLLTPLLTILEDIEGDNGSGISYFGISESGDIAYIQGSRNQELELVWVDLAGNIEPLALPLKPYQVPRISPDGTKIAVNLGFLGQDDDIWIYDLSTLVFSRFTFGKSMFCPIWTTDGQSLYFASLKGKIMQKQLTGSAAITLIEVGSNMAHYPITISPDNRYMVMNQLGGVNEGELMMLDLNEPDQPKFIFTSDAYDYGGDFSPDGKYILYGSNETGRLEIYIKSFPDMKSKWQVSTEGGLSPQWSPDGKSIYYINNVGKMMVVPVQPRPFFSPGKPQVMFDVSQMYFPNSPVTNYDLSPDGKRFLMVRNTGFRTNVLAFNYITNWITEVDQYFSDKK